MGTYGFSDFFGRWVAKPDVIQALNVQRTLKLTLARAVLLPILVFAGVRPWFLIRTPWYEPLLMVVMGASNGLLATAAMSQGPQLVARDVDRETAAYVLVIALYLGLATGATAALAFQDLYG